ANPFLLLRSLRDRIDGSPADLVLGVSHSDSDGCGALRRIRHVLLRPDIHDDRRFKRIRSNEMTNLQFQARTLGKVVRAKSCLLAAIVVTWMFTGICATAQLAADQTNGFGNNQLVTFTYLQNFDCVDQPTLDLDFNGVQAQSDPKEMQTPICQ